MMMDHFISRVFQGTLHVDKIHVQFKIANITNGLPVSSPLVDRFHTETGDRLRLHNNGAKFRTGVKFSPRYNNRGDSRRHGILW